MVSARAVKTRPDEKLADLDAQISSIQTQIGTKIVEKSELQIKYTDKYPRIKELETELKDLNIKLIALEKNKKDIILIPS